MRCGIVFNAAGTFGDEERDAVIEWVGANGDAIRNDNKNGNL